MNGKALISVIVPIYNVEKYLAKCIDSIIEQSYDNLEIILVDDGSPDRCPQICDTYAKKDSRIRVVHRKNGGLSAARNNGIDIASGDYIMFVDSDDYINPLMVEILYNNLKEKNADMSICNVETFTEEYEAVHNIRKGNKTIKKGVVKGKEILQKKLFEENNWVWVVAWNKLYKKALFDDVRYPEHKIHEDEYVIHSLLLQCDRVSCVDGALYYYLVRNDSITGRKYTINRLDKVEAVFKRAHDYIFESGFDEAFMRTLDIGVDEFRNYYSYGGRKKDQEHKKRNRELQRIFRQVLSKYLICKRKISMKYSMDYISLYLAWNINVAKKKILRETRRILKKV